MLAHIRELLGLPDLTGLALEALERRTRSQLLDWATRLGLSDLQRLTKHALADRLRDALARLSPAPDAPPPDDPTGATAAHKFDLGLRDDHPVEHIPWGYGRDRVTAMPIDPERLFVYWEVTDDAIARARDGLGTGGPGAWLDLRLYDVSGRIFDGTNAHAYVDQRVERDTRQWFFTVGKPTSTAVVEIGLLSHEGYFVRIARSGRAEFPRREPAPAGPVEWLTVRTASGPVGPGAAGAAGTGDGTPPPAPGSDVHAAPGPAAPSRSDADGGHRVDWRSPVLRTTWESGPFTWPVESPAYVEERHEGTVTVRTWNGRTHVVYGPWQVVIRGLDAWVTRAVVSTWELAYTIDGEATPSANGHGVAWRAGASEQAGASERWRHGGSERRLRGASEVYYAGASELRSQGASERLVAGASERRAGGASERHARGASDLLPGGGERRDPR